MENKKPSSEILIYEGNDGETHIEVRFEGETIWLTIEQIAELFNR